MLKVEGVSKSFGSVKALRNATITIGAHEVVGLIGENGPASRHSCGFSPAE